MSKSFRRACFFWQGFASFFIWNFLFAPLFVSFLSRFVSFFKATSNNTFQSKQVHTSGLLLLLVMSYKMFEYCSICVWESAVGQELPYSQTVLPQTGMLYSWYLILISMFTLFYLRRFSSTVMLVQHALDDFVSYSP